MSVAATLATQGVPIGARIGSLFSGVGPISKHAGQADDAFQVLAKRAGDIEQYLAVNPGTEEGAAARPPELNAMLQDGIAASDAVQAAARKVQESVTRRHPELFVERTVQEDTIGSVIGKVLNPDVPITRRSRTVSEVPAQVTALANASTEAVFRDFGWGFAVPEQAALDRLSQAIDGVRHLAQQVDD